MDRIARELVGWSPETQEAYLHDEEQESTVAIDERSADSSTVTVDTMLDDVPRLSQEEMRAVFGFVDATSSSARDCVNVHGPHTFVTVYVTDRQQSMSFCKRCGAERCGVLVDPGDPFSDCLHLVNHPATTLHRAASGRWRQVVPAK